MKTLVTVHIPNSKEAWVFLTNGTMTLLNLVNWKIGSLMWKDNIIWGFSKALQAGTFHYMLKMNDWYWVTDVQRELHELVSKIPWSSIQ
jgi:hypothetical protein